MYPRSYLNEIILLSYSVYWGMCCDCNKINYIYLHFGAESLVRGLHCIMLYKHTEHTDFIFSNLKKLNAFLPEMSNNWTLVYCVLFATLLGIFTNCKISFRHCSLFCCSDCFPSDVKGFPDVGSNTQCKRGKSSYKLIGKQLILAVKQVLIAVLLPLKCLLFVSQQGKLFLQFLWIKRNKNRSDVIFC